VSETELDVEAEEDEDAEITEEDALGYTAATGTLEHSEGELLTHVEGRCEAETTVGGTLYRCGLEVLHEGDHAFSPVDLMEPPAEDQEKKMRQASDRLDREAERHWNRIVEIMGPDAGGLIPCELCFVKTPGFRWDAAPNTETTTRVRVALGLPDITNYPPSATERVCDDCRGTTRVKTGSLDPLYETKKCDACAGKGYISTRPRLNTPEEDEPATASDGNVVPFPDDGVERDMFGTPATDPDYGKMPNMRARPVDYWQTNRV
jgi:hypothetical protein